MIFLYVYISFCFFFLKLDKTEDEEPQSTSANPVLELELTEEKLPMTLSRQEVGRPIRACRMLLTCLFFWMNNQSFVCM